MTARPATTSTQPAKRRRGTNPQPLDAVRFDGALLTLKTASAVSGLSGSSLYRKAASDPSFPKLVKMGLRCTRIRAAELTAWLAAQGRDPAPGAGVEPGASRGNEEEDSGDLAGARIGAVHGVEALAAAALKRQASKATAVEGA